MKSNDQVQNILAANADLLADGFQGCFIEEGWSDLLEEVLNEWRLVDAPPIMKIKSKLGSLRVTAGDQSHPEARRLRRKAMKLSETTCEECGQPGGSVLVDAYRCVLCRIHEKTRAGTVGSG